MPMNRPSNIAGPARTTPAGMVPVIAIPEIYLPRAGTDLMRWAVIACDQHTSDAAYWEETARFVGKAPSTLLLILPEYYLEHPDQISVSERIATINRTMCRYLEEGILATPGPGCMAICRSTPRHPVRKGLILAIDLEAYDFTPGKHNLIRATEGTVLERIPPRMAIRRDAVLELPHVQLLIDDPRFSVIDPLLAGLQALYPEPLYRTGLMQQGGAVEGWFVPASSPLLAAALTALANLDSLCREGLMMVVGDGNHSLATAKTHWEHIRDQSEPDHPARFALVEVVNLHDPGLEFEPIHRVVSGIDTPVFFAMLGKHFAGQAGQILPADQAAGCDQACGLAIPILTREGRYLLRIDHPDRLPAVAAIQEFLDSLVRQTSARIDYIHGEAALENLVRKGDIGLVLPVMDKSQLFPGIVRDGLLPRKTFSMGDANEKRYYFECRKIR